MSDLFTVEKFEEGILYNAPHMNLVFFIPAIQHRHRISAKIINGNVNAAKEDCLDAARSWTDLQFKKAAERQTPQ